MFAKAIGRLLYSYLHPANGNSPKAISKAGAKIGAAGS
jgi:hypothetical protein